MKNKFSISKLFIHLALILFCVCCIVPLLLVISISFTPDKAIGLYGYTLFPKEFTLEAYKFALTGSSSLWNGYLVTFSVTAIGTTLSLLVVSMLAYGLSRRDVKYKNAISMMVFITMLFNGGLVPTYILYTRYLNIDNTLLVLILPLLVNAWNVMLMRNFFATSIPHELIESAKIDGAGELRTYFSIVVPISKPTFATIGLIVGLAYWNDWWLALMYVEDRSLMPLQYVLQSILLDLQIILSDILLRETIESVPTESMRMALCVFSVIPIILIYPFVQKYLVKGMTVGAVKG